MLRVLVLALALWIVSPARGEEAPRATIQEIAQGIEAHIAERSASDGGVFRLEHEGRELRLRLVRVHLEYLSNLGPGRHFACVDLVHEDGNVYDVDFFMEGKPGAMRVTQTTVHKLNGQPYYTWEQTADGGWRTVPADGADNRLLGVIQGEDAFDFVYRVTLPELAAAARLWLPMPASDEFQTVALTSVRAPTGNRVLTDAAYSNRVLFFELEPGDSGKEIELRFAVERREKSAYPAGEPDLNPFLNPERLVPADPTFKETAEGVVAGKEGGMVRARALYDHVIEQMRYMKYGKGWGKGDAMYACDAKTGNCTDYHAYFIALARAVDIPARFAIGAAIPSERDDGGIDGYHCWAEFYADGKWWPVDISEADKYSSLATYYFGRHPANRIELSRGRDLVVDPGPQSGPINFLAYPLLEVRGEPVKAKVEFSFVRRQPGKTEGGI